MTSNDDRFPPWLKEDSIGDRSNRLLDTVPIIDLALGPRAPALLAVQAAPRRPKAPSEQLARDSRHSRICRFEPLHLPRRVAAVEGAPPGAPVATIAMTPGTVKIRSLRMIPSRTEPRSMGSREPAAWACQKSPVPMLPRKAITAAMWRSLTSRYTRIGRAAVSNDEVERRGIAPTQNEGSLSKSSTPSLPQRSRGPRSPEPIVMRRHA
jgi:hypothetical protein